MKKITLMLLMIGVSFNLYKSWSFLIKAAHKLLE